MRRAGRWWRPAPAITPRRIWKPRSRVRRLPLRSIDASVSLDCYSRIPFPPLAIALPSMAHRDLFRHPGRQHHRAVILSVHLGGPSLALAASVVGEKDVSLVMLDDHFA